MRAKPLNKSSLSLSLSLATLNHARVRFPPVAVLFLNKYLSLFPLITPPKLPMREHVNNNQLTRNYLEKIDSYL